MGGRPYAVGSDAGRTRADRSVGAGREEGRAEAGSTREGRAEEEVTSFALSKAPVRGSRRFVFSDCLELVSRVACRATPTVASQTRARVPPYDCARLHER